MKASWHGHTPFRKKEPLRNKQDIDKGPSFLNKFSTYFEQRKKKAPTRDAWTSEYFVLGDKTLKKIPKLLCNPFHRRKQMLWLMGFQGQNGKSPLLVQHFF